MIKIEQKIDNSGRKYIKYNKTIYIFDINNHPMFMLYFFNDNDCDSYFNEENTLNSFIFWECIYKEVNIKKYNFALNLLNTLNK